LQREVGANTSGTWLGNDDTHRPLHQSLGFCGGSASAGGEVWVRDWKSELLLYELGNDDRLWPCALDLSLGGSWMVACHWKSELLVALLPCSVTMTHGSVSC
jgi:hypothetical protein